MATKHKTHDIHGFHEWLVKRGRTVATADNYKWQMSRSLSTRRITDRLLSSKFSPNTRRLCLSALRAWARYTFNAKLLGSLDDIKLPPPENVTDKRPLDIDQWRELRVTIANDDELTDVERACLQMICRRGLRAGAVVGLQRRQVSDAATHGTLIFQSKGRTLRYGVGPLRDQLSVLAGQSGRWKRVADLLVPNAAVSRQIPAARKRLWQLIRDEGALIGIPPEQMYPHRLRHTCATEFYKKTKDIKALQDYMQWADVKTAARYVSHMRRDQLDELAESILDNDTEGP